MSSEPVDERALETGARMEAAGVGCADDLDDDLAAQRASGGVRIALGFMLAAGIAELGAFLPLAVSLEGSPAYLRVWVYTKLALAMLALVAVVRASRLREGSFALWTGAAVALVVETSAFFVFGLSHGLFSCFGTAAILPSVVTLFAVLPLRAACARAREARERLAAQGIDEAF